MATVRQTGVNIIRRIIKQAKKPKKFSDVLSFNDFWDKALAQEAIKQQTGKYFQPLVDRNIANLRDLFASRNLLRSGIRTRREIDYLTDVADQEAQMRQQLLGQREKEAVERYGLEQERYEQDPVGYRIPVRSIQPVLVGDDKGISESDRIPMTGTTFQSPFGSPKYGIGYRDIYKNYMNWYKNKFGNF